MEEKLTWDQITDRYRDEWVELVNYDWDETEPYPASGVVRCHSSSRKGLSVLMKEDSIKHSAIVFTGQLTPSFAVRSFIGGYLVPLRNETKDL